MLDAHQKMLGPAFPSLGLTFGDAADVERVLALVVPEDESIDAVAELKGCHVQSPMPFQHHRNAVTNSLPTRCESANCIGFTE
jgi:hypothetical protein